MIFVIQTESIMPCNMQIVVSVVLCYVITFRGGGGMTILI